jgi:hypothetical protein
MRHYLLSPRLYFLSIFCLFIFSTKANSFSSSFGFKVNPPTDIILSKNYIEENNQEDQLIGELFAISSSQDDVFVYELLNIDKSDADSEFFYIKENMLYTKAVFNAEDRSIYSIRIRVIDSQENELIKTFEIRVDDVNEYPQTGIALSNTQFDENNQLEEVIGEFTTEDLDVSKPHQYAFASGEGDQDNGLFTIEGNQLKAATIFNFEERSQFSILIVSIDSDGSKINQSFDISINDINDIASITLTKDYIHTGNESFAVVSEFLIEDEDPNDTHSVSLISGAGDDDNQYFQIEGFNLISNVSFDYFIQQSLSIRVQISESNGAVNEQVFTIVIREPNSAPTNISLSNIFVFENKPEGQEIGELSTTDSNAWDEHTYSIESGNGDWESFTISGSVLYLSVDTFNSTKETLEVMVKSADSFGAYRYKTFTIYIEINPIQKSYLGVLVGGSLGSYDYVDISDDGSRMIIGVNGVNPHVRIYDIVEGSIVQNGVDLSVGSVLMDQSVGVGANLIGIDLSGDGSTLAYNVQYYNVNTDQLVSTVRVFELKDGNWLEKGNEISRWGVVPNNEKKFGFSMHLNYDGSLLKIGDPSYDNDDGRMFVYDLLENNRWSFTESNLPFTNDSERQSTQFGYAIDMTKPYKYLNFYGTRMDIIVGAPNYKRDGITTGVVYLDTFSDINFGEFQIEGIADGDRFGSSVSISNKGNYIAVHAPGGDHPNLGLQNVGYTQIFKKNPVVSAGYDFEEVQTIYGTIENGSNYYNKAIDLSADGSTLAIGYSRADTTGDGLNNGKVEIYRLYEGQFVKFGEDLILFPNTTDEGFSVSLSDDGSQLIVGGTEAYLYFITKTDPVITNISTDFTYLQSGTLSATSTSPSAINFISSNPEIFRVDKNQYQAINTGTVTLTIQQDAENLFNKTNQDVTVTIEKASPNLSFEDPYKDINDSEFELNAISSSTATITFISLDTNVIAIEGNIATIKGLGTASITISQESTTNYLSSTITGTITVSELITPELNIGEFSAVYGETFELIAETDSSAEIRYTTEQTDILSIDGSFATAVGAGTAIITAIVDRNDVYYEATVSSTVTVQKANPVLSEIEDLELDLSESSVELNVTSTSSATIKYSSSNSSVLSFESNRALINNIGYGIITIAQDENDNYNAATSTVTFEVRSIAGDAINDRNIQHVTMSNDATRLIFGQSANRILNYSLNQNQWESFGSSIDTEVPGLFGLSIDTSADGMIFVTSDNVANDDQNNIIQAGYSVVYEYQNNDWIQKGSKVYGVNSTRFGSAVSISSNGLRFAASAPYENSYKGVVRVYDFIEGDWQQIGEDIYGIQNNDKFGTSLALSSDGTSLIVASLNGATRVFQFDGNQWTPKGNSMELSSMVDGYLRNKTVAISSDGSIIAIGAESDENGTNTGQVKIFKFLNNNWVQIGQTLFGAGAETYFGYNISLNQDGTRLAVGTPFDSKELLNAGRVSYYQYINGSWIQYAHDTFGYFENQKHGASLKLSSDGTKAVVLDSYDGTAAVHNLVLIEKQLPTITGWEDLIKQYDDPDFDLNSFAIDSDGLLSFTSSNPLVATIEGSTVHIEGPGITRLSISVGETEDYFAATFEITLTVKNDVQLTGFEDLTVTEGDPSFELNILSNSQGAISYSSSNEEVIFVVGDTFEVGSAGSAVIQLNQEATDLFNSYTSTITIVVNTKPIPTFSELPDLNLLTTQVPFDISFLSDSTGAISYNSSDESVASISGSTISINGPGEAVITVTQEADQTYASISTTFSINIAELIPPTIQFESREYNINTSTFELESSSTSSGQITYSSSNLDVITIDGTTATVVEWEVR